MLVEVEVKVCEEAVTNERMWFSDVSSDFSKKNDLRIASDCIHFDLLGANNLRGGMLPGHP